MDVKGVTGEIMDGDEEHVIGSWIKVILVIK